MDYQPKQVAAVNVEYAFRFTPWISVTIRALLSFNHWTTAYSL
jgi:hypothetical protein